MKQGVKKHRGVYCTDEEWAWVSSQARAAGTSIVDHLVHCGLNMDVPEGGVESPTGESVLSADERSQILERVEELSGLFRIQFGRDRAGGTDMLGMVRVCFERARADYLDKYGSFAFDDLMEEVNGGAQDDKQ